MLTRNRGQRRPIVMSSPTKVLKEDTNVKDAVDQSSESKSSLDSNLEKNSYSKLIKSNDSSTPDKAIRSKRTKAILEVDVKDIQEINQDNCLSSLSNLILPAETIETQRPFEHISKRHEYLSPVKAYSQDSGAMDDLNISDSYQNETEFTEIVEQPPLSSAYQPLSSPDKLPPGIHDDVLKDLLFQINCTGRIPSPMKRLNFKHSKSDQPLDEFRKQQSCNIHCELKVEKILNRIWKDGFVNKELDTKDQYLAAAGLMRHGLGDVLRKRREYIGKELSRSVVGRLRPNPRPRRFSDMINQQLIQNGLLVTRSTNYNRHRHDAPPGLHLSVAQITAAKKLNSAKSRCQNLIKNRRGKLSTLRKHPIIEDKVQNDENLRRSKRRAGLAQHIDWKFCYSDTGAENVVPKKQKSMKEPGLDLFISEEEVYDDFDENEFTSGRFSRKKAIKRTNLCSQRKRPSTVEDHFDDDEDGEDSFDELTRSKPRNRLWKTRPRAGRKFTQKDRARHLDQDNETFEEDGEIESDDLSSIEVLNQALDRRPPILGRFFSSRPNQSKMNRQNIAENKRRSRYRRLNLLDRLILGLHCTVTQLGDKIQIKQLHQADLNILTQRTFKTGFVIQSLALKQNPTTRDAEYNVVLTYFKDEPKDSNNTSPFKPSDCEIRGKRSESSNFIDETMKSLYLRKILRKKRFQQQLKGANNVASKAHSRYHQELQQRSAPLLLQHRRSKSIDRVFKSFQLNALRRTASDTNLCIERRESVLRSVKRMETKCAENAAAQVMKIMRRIKASKLLSDDNMHDSPESDYELDKLPWRPNYSANRRNVSCYGDADSVTSSKNISHPSKRPKLVADSSSVKEHTDREGISRFQTLANVASSLPDPSVSASIQNSVTGEHSNATTATSASALLSSQLLLQQQLAFKRHSPRKIVRKVYTGGSTLPKILNRKRPGGIISAPSHSSHSGAADQVQNDSNFSNINHMTGQPSPSVHSVDTEAEIQSTTGSLIENMQIEEDIQQHSIENLKPETEETEAMNSSSSTLHQLMTSTNQKYPSPSSGLIVSASEDSSKNPARALSASQLLRLRHRQPDGFSHSSSNLTHPSSTSAIRSHYSQSHLTSEENLTDLQNLASHNGNIPSPLLYEETITTSPVSNIQQPSQYIDSEISNSYSNAVDDSEFELAHWPPGTNSTTVGINKTKVILSNVAPQPCNVSRQSRSGLVPNIAAAPSNTSQNRMLRIVTQPSVQNTSQPTVYCGQKLLVPGESRRAPLSLYHAGGAVTSNSLIKVDGLQSASPFYQQAQPQTPLLASSVKSNKTLVHKYHSFRKILPKSPDGKSQSQLQFHHSTLGTVRSTPSLSIPIPSNGPMMDLYHQSNGATVSQNSQKNGPNSQVLKTLLEYPQRIGSPSSSCQNRLTSVRPSNGHQVTASGPGNRVQPVVPQSHQSRGTWQLGNRVTVLNATRTTPPGPNASSQSNLFSQTCGDTSSNQN